MGVRVQVASNDSILVIMNDDLNSGISRVAFVVFEGSQKSVLFVPFWAGQVQEQLQQSLFGRGDLNTGQPGYQFWKVRGSPLAQRVQGILELLVELKFLRRPIQWSELSFRAMFWMLAGVAVISSLKQTCQDVKGYS